MLFLSCPDALFELHNTHNLLPSCPGLPFRSQFYLQYGIATMADIYRTYSY